jgi:lysophospholipase L1-like esterase
VSRHLWWLVLLVVAALVAGCSSDGGQPSGSKSGGGPRVVTSSTKPDATRFQRYVAMGDSFSAGPLIPTTNLAGGCARSDHNYPSLIAKRLGVRTFVDVTCSGARSRDVARVQHTFGDARIPPQDDQLNPATDLVTIGIGGNDLTLFSSLVQGCTRLGRTDPTGSPCSRSPHATVVLVGYLRLVPDSGTCAKLPLAVGDYPTGRRIGEALDQAQRRAARAAGVRFVDMYAKSRGHDICSRDPWVNGRVTDRTRALAYHPFESGMRADAAAVLRILG